MKLFLASPLLLTLVYQIKGACDLEQAWRLYFDVSGGTEDAYIAAHPRRSGPVNSTRLCGALGKLSQCEEETECKEMAKGLLYTTASQLHTSSHTREIGCAKAFVEKHGNPANFAADGTCSMVESTSMDDDFGRFVDCMTGPFDSIIFERSREKHEFCDALERISKCGEAVPSCHNDFTGLAHAIANFPDLYDAKKGRGKWFPWRNETFPTYTPSNDPVKLACFEKFIEKHNKASLFTDEENTNQEDLWSKIEKLNQKFLSDLKLLIDEP